MNKESTLTTEYHYKNDYTGLEYDLYCHGDNEGHADVLKSYKLGDYANKKGYNGIATSIIVFPEDKYGHQIDELVKTCQARVDDLYNQLEACFAHKSKIIDYFDAIFQRISENGWQLDSKVNNGGNNADYLNNKLQNNEYFVTVCSDRVDRTGYNFVNKMASSVMKIFEVADDNKQNEAMSKFEAEKTRISNKERKIDLIMKKLETEQEAINTEMDAVQKVENENISKTFKMFA